MAIAPPPLISSDLLAAFHAPKPYNQMTRREQKLLDKLNAFGATWNGDSKKEKRVGDTYACYHIATRNGSPRTFRTLDELDLWFAYESHSQPSKYYYTFEQVLARPALINDDEYRHLENKAFFKKLMTKKGAL